VEVWGEGAGTGVEEMESFAAEKEGAAGVKEVEGGEDGWPRVKEG
jgi:hypothetical protein